MCEVSSARGLYVHFGELFFPSRWVWLHNAIWAHQTSILSFSWCRGTDKLGETSRLKAIVLHVINFFLVFLSLYYPSFFYLIPCPCGGFFPRSHSRFHFLLVTWHLYSTQQYLILCSNEMLLLQDTDRKIKGKNVNDLSKTTCESEIEYKRHSLFILLLNCPETKSLNQTFIRGLSEWSCMPGNKLSGFKRCCHQKRLEEQSLPVCPTDRFCWSEKSMLKICYDKYGWKLQFIFS